MIGLINLLLKLSKQRLGDGGNVSNIQRGECWSETPINHGDFLAERMNCGVWLSMHAATESLATTVAQARADMEANQPL